MTGRPWYDSSMKKEPLKLMPLGEFGKLVARLTRVPKATIGGPKPEPQRPPHPHVPESPRQA
ncbi:MAG: hypothetical protein NVSMB64_28980 [Candidatus Velthaea sp.]